MARIFNDPSIKSPVELIEKDAPGLVEELSREMAGENKEKVKMTKSQVRRFYQEYVRIRQKVQSEGYEQNVLSLKMLVPKVVYAAAKRQGMEPKIPEKFKDWFKDNIAAISCAEDTEVFGCYFESFIGFFYYFQGGQEDNRNFRHNAKDKSYQRRNY